MAASLQCDPRVRSWQRFDVRHVEDLANAVLGADLDVVQMPGPPVRGSLAFSALRGVLFSSGLIEGNVTLYGPLAPDAITIGIGLHFGPNSRLWLHPVHNGNIGIVLPGDTHDASLTVGSLYVTATLSAIRLKQEAARHGLVLNPRVVARTGLHSQPIAETSLASLTNLVACIHRRGAAAPFSHPDIGGAVLRAVIEHCAQLTSAAEAADIRVNGNDRTAIVSRARKYIANHLDGRLTLDIVARATGTSIRTLVRAFVEILNDTPADYIRRLRLHQIRRALTSRREARTAIATIAARWGMTEPGRMAGWYCDVFGELPSTTRAASRARRRLTNEAM